MFDLNKKNLMQLFLLFIIGTTIGCDGILYPIERHSSMIGNVVDIYFAHVVGHVCGLFPTAQDHVCRRLTVLHPNSQQTSRMTIFDVPRHKTDEESLQDRSKRIGLLLLLVPNADLYAGGFSRIVEAIDKLKSLYSMYAPSVSTCKMSSFGFDHQNLYIVYPNMDRRIMVLSLELVRPAIECIQSQLTDPIKLAVLAALLYKYDFWDLALVDCMQRINIKALYWTFGIAPRTRRMLNKPIPIVTDAPEQRSEQVSHPQGRGEVIPEREDPDAFRGRVERSVLQFLEDPAQDESDFEEG